LHHHRPRHPDRHDCQTEIARRRCPTGVKKGAPLKRALKKQLFLKLLQKRKDCSFNGCNLFFF
jgi:hypothetical protein